MNTLEKLQPLEDNFLFSDQSSEENANLQEILAIMTDFAKNNPNVMYTVKRSTIIGFEVKARTDE